VHCDNFVAYIQLVGIVRPIVLVTLDWKNSSQCGHKHAQIISYQQNVW